MSNKKKFIIFIACVALILVSYIKFFKPTNNINSDNGISYGNPNAKIKMVEYMSFQCIDCYNLHKNISEILKKKIDNGEIYYTLKHVDFEKFKYDDVIFNKIDNIEDFKTIDYVMTNYPTWKKMKDVQSVEDFLKLKESHPDRVNMQKAVSNEKEDLKIDFIPTFYINGKKHVGEFSAKEFNEIIDAAQ